jgi:PAS domain S-box-containing protein
VRTGAGPVPPTGEHRFAAIVACVDDVVFLLDRGQRVVGLYGRWLARHRVDPGDYLGRTLRQIHGAKAAGYVEACRRALAGEPVVYEAPMAVAGGEHIFQTSFAPWREDGRVVGVVGVTREVTERHRAQRALQARARRQAAVALLGQQALAGQRLTALFDDAARLAVDTLEIGGCGILRLDPGRRDLRLVAGAGWQGGLPTRARFPAGELSLAGYTLRARGPVIVDDLRRERRFRSPQLRRQRVVSAASTLIGHSDQPLGVLQVFARKARPFSEDDLVFLQAVANVLALATIRQDEEEVRGELLERLLWAQEEERRRIARELHDEAGQDLTSLLLRLRALEDSRSLREAVSRAARLRGLAARTIDGLGRLARGLRPGVLESLGLRPALERLADEHAAALRVPVTVDATGFGRARPSPEVETAIYRIAQEALANAGRHARAHRLEMLLARERDRVRLVVRDDGRGFDTEAALRSSVRRGRLGLQGMRERVLMLGGSLSVLSQRGKGTTVSVTVPAAGRARRLG